MNATNCLNLILTRIQENIHLFQVDENINQLSNVICKLSSAALRKPISCTLLKNILLTLKKFHAKDFIQDTTYKLFLKDVNSFYKTQNLCNNYKLVIISCFEPAIEIEMISLLKLCTTISNVSEMNIIKVSVENSVIVKACYEKPKLLKKVSFILKKAFLLTEGNLYVCYLNFCLYNSMKFSFYDQILAKDIYHLNSFFHFPYDLLNEEEEDILLKKLMSSCIETIKLNLCSKKDIIFYTSVFPQCYYKILTIYVKKHSDSAFQFFKYLRSDMFSKFSDYMFDITLAQEHCIWIYINN